MRRAVARVQGATGGRLPGPLAWLALALALVAAAAGARVGGVGGATLDVLQLLPTLGLLAALALLVDVGLSSPVPGMVPRARLGSSSGPLSL